MLLPTSVHVPVSCYGASAAHDDDCPLFQLSSASLIHNTTRFTALLNELNHTAFRTYADGMHDLVNISFLHHILAFMPSTCVPLCQKIQQQKMMENSVYSLGGSTKAAMR